MINGENSYPQIKEGRRAIDQCKVESQLYNSNEKKSRDGTIRAEENKNMKYCL